MLQGTQTPGRESLKPRESGVRRPVPTGFEKKGPIAGSLMRSMTALFLTYAEHRFGLPSTLEEFKSSIRYLREPLAPFSPTKEVAFEPVPPDDLVRDRIDEAYRVKYQDSPYLGPVVGRPARSATVKASPP